MRADLTILFTLHKKLMLLTEFYVTSHRFLLKYLRRLELHHRISSHYRSLSRAPPCIPQYLRNDYTRHIHFYSFYLTKSYVSLYS